MMVIMTGMNDGDVGPLENHLFITCGFRLETERMAPKPVKPLAADLPTRSTRTSIHPRFADVVRSRCHHHRRLLS